MKIQSFSDTCSSSSLITNRKSTDRNVHDLWSNVDRGEVGAIVGKERRSGEAGAFVGKAGAALDMFGNASSPFCKPVARQC